MIKTIVVTGAGSGIGLSSVKLLLENDFCVFACTRRTSDNLKNLSINKNLKIFEFDLANKTSIKNLVKDIFSHKENNLYGLVNCAGIAHGGLFSMTTTETLESVFQINYFHQLYLTQLISKKFIRNKGGSIVNIASTAGIFGDEGTLAYGGSKAALIHSTKVLASELGRFFIRVNSISPAVVNTKMSSEMDTKSIEKLNARKAIIGDIESLDIANLIMFLISDESKNISGQNIRVDQGMFA